MKININLAGISLKMKLFHSQSESETLTEYEADKIRTTGNSPLQLTISDRKLFVLILTYNIKNKIKSYHCIAQKPEHQPIEHCSQTQSNS